MRRIKLVCLLPVRNGEADLPRHIDSVACFADAIVALDDGSTDGTRRVLEASSSVQVLLTNPPRPDYQGWDDAANRSRLLEAAAALEPEWILSLDADERIAPDDGEALRTFVEGDAIPGCAYGFKVFRMWEDLHHYSRAGLWVYRLFAFEPGQRFPERRLHFVPIPTSIPRARWLRTTIRIQHLASLTEERRRARFQKYREADPHNEFQHSYRDLLEPADDDVRPWEPRPRDHPVLAIEPGRAVAAFEPDRPAVSAIIISRDDEDRIARSVASVVNQACPWPFEVIVVTSGSDRTAQVVQERFPEVTLIELPRPALPGEARNAGLRVARGDYVSFPGSHVELPAGSLAARLRAHDLGYAMVTGTMLNGTQTLAGWASYFLDHSTVLPGRPSTELSGAPAHCSYTREALLMVGGFPEELRAGEDTVVNEKLAALGYVAYRARDVTVIHHSPCRTPWRLIAHHFVRGRGYGRLLLESARGRGRLLAGRAAYLLLQAVRRLRLTDRHVRAWGADLQWEYWRAFPLVVVGAVAAWAGMWYEIVRPNRRNPSVHRGKPVQAPPAVATRDWAAARDTAVSDTSAGGTSVASKAEAFGRAPDSLTPLLNRRGELRRKFIRRLRQCELARWPVRAPDPLPGSLFPAHRIVAYYGNPLSERMGILGELPPDEMLAKLERTAAEWAKADTARKVWPALHLIATVAQGSPGPGGLYRLRMSDELIEKVAGWAEPKGWLLFLDLQIGHSTVPAELPRLVPFLQRPYVHLALDPEFAMKRGGVPGVRIGTLDASDVTCVVHFLANIVEHNQLTPKVLVVHRFTRRMLTNTSQIRLDPRVQVVVNMDGFGSPRSKQDAYRLVIAPEPVQFTGLKLFYKNDKPMMKPNEVLALFPEPLYIQYQ